MLMSPRNSAESEYSASTRRVAGSNPAEGAMIRCNAWWKCNWEHKEDCPHFYPHERNWECNNTCDQSGGSKCGACKGKCDKCEARFQCWTDRANAEAV